MTDLNNENNDLDAQAVKPEVQAPDSTKLNLDELDQVSGGGLQSIINAHHKRYDF